MTTPEPIEVTQDQVEAFRRDGAVCLRHVIAPHWIEALRAGAEQDVKTPGPGAQVYTKRGDPGFHMHDYDLWRRIPEMRDFAYEGPLAAIAGRLMGATQVNLFLDLLIVKEPGTERITDWHQDGPYFAVNGQQFCASWVPLFPVTREMTVEFVKGSHLWERWFAPIDSQLDGIPYQGDNFEPVPDIESHRDDYELLTWELEPGDCVFFHMLSVHQGRIDPHTSVLRRTVTHRWMGDDTVYALREPEAEFPTFATNLKDGEPMRNCPEFPTIWKVAA